MCVRDFTQEIEEIFKIHHEDLSRKFIIKNLLGSFRSDTYIWCVISIHIGWRMQGWLKGQSPFLKTAIMVPRKRLSRAIAATFWPRGRRALRARRPRGPNVKKRPWHNSRRIKSNRQKANQIIEHVINYMNSRCRYLDKAIPFVIVMCSCYSSAMWIW